MIRQLLTAFGALGFAMVASAPTNAGTPLPRIQSVSFTGSAGNYTATIAGINFGPAPSGIPCTACQPLQLQVVDLASQPVQQVINVTAWSDNSITVTGIAIPAGDALRIAAYNETVGNVAAWGGKVSRSKGTPHIGSIVASGSGQSLTLTITGSGFGAAPTWSARTPTPPISYSPTTTPPRQARTGFHGTQAFAGPTIATA